jgi:putative phosphoribosyl transferase
MNFQGFQTRQEAGRELGKRLAAMNIANPVVLALPRGGVPVAAEIARALKAPLDLLLVRKIGVPSQPELAAAAVVDGDHPDLVLNDAVMRMAGLHRGEIEDLMKVQLAEIERRRRLYLGDRPPVDISGQSVIVVDDGIATGTTVRAALRALRGRKPKRLILAVPVAPEDSLAELQGQVDDLICLQQPSPFYAIGQYYADFHQVEDSEVIALMKMAGTPA